MDKQEQAWTIDTKVKTYKVNTHATEKINPIGKSKLARRLVPLFVAMVALPLTITVLVVGRIGQEQILTTARTMEGINGVALQGAGEQFQRLGQETVRRSSKETAQISFQASQAASRQWEKNQADSLATSGHEFAQVTQRSFDGAMHQSLAANRDVLNNVNSRMGLLFASSAHYTQARVSDRVQSAILAQINMQMQERARQMAQSVGIYIQTYQDYMALTAQMLNLYEGDKVGQKAILDALIRRDPMLVTVSVLNKEGQETTRSASDHVVSAAELGNHAAEPYFQTAIQDRPYVSLEDLPQAGRAPILRLAMPIELYHGKAVGVLTARFSLDDLWDTLRSTRIGKSGFVSVLDRRDVVLLAPHVRPGELLSRSARVEGLGWRLVVAQPREEVMRPVQSFKSDIAKNTQMAMIQMHQDIQASSLATSARLQKDNGKLRAATMSQVQVRTDQIFRRLQQKTNRQTQEEMARMQQAIQSQAQQAQNENDRQMALAAADASSSLAQRIPPLTKRVLQKANRRLSFLGLLIILISCLLSCVIALLMADAIVRPIMRLVQGTRALAQGHLDKRVDERAPAEIGDLAAAFNRMALSLQQSRTDLNSAEAQLVQSAKLASLGTLSAGVAHELNQPVAIVRGLSQQLQREPGLPQEALEDLALIEGQTSRMMKIIKHLRTFCRNGTAEQVSVNINQVIHDCFILIDAQLKSHDISVELALCQEVLMVTGDANELEQVFINLLTNARDALERSPEAHLTIRSRVEQEACVIEFRDNGPGIPIEAAAHIFDPFFTTKEVGKGTGLGLSISHSIIEKHHGTLTARNDGGAVFLITLPLEIQKLEIQELERPETEGPLRKAA
ncbi:MAG: ATP-binding protein [Janthinobacterium lividum]